MENFSEYVNQHQNYYLDLQFKSIQTQHKLNSYSLHTSTFDPSSLKDKYYERCSSFFESEKLFVPKKVKEEYEVILGDAFYLLLSDSAMGLQEISSYISSQVPHLLSVKNKLGELSFEYQEISTFIVKVVLQDIQEAFFFQDYAYGCYGHYHNREVYKKAWRALTEIDKFEQTYSFRNKTYENIKSEIKRKCAYYMVDTRTKSEKKKDFAKECFDESLGCIFIILFMLICLIFGAIF